MRKIFLFIFIVLSFNLYGAKYYIDAEFLSSFKNYDGYYEVSVYDKTYGNIKLELEPFEMRQRNSNENFVYGSCKVLIKSYYLGNCFVTFNRFRPKSR